MYSADNINGGSKGTPKRRILVMMAEAPVPGLVEKGLSPPLDDESAARLHECFVLDVADKCLQVPDTDTVVSCSPAGTLSFFRETIPGAKKYIPQRGKSAHARLSNVFRTLAEPGAAIVVLGTSAPALPGRCIELAFDVLDSGDVDVVLGPATGGGCYLVGMSVPRFELLHYVPWRGTESLDVCIEHAAKLGMGWYLLPEWHVVRTPADLDHLKNELLGRSAETPFAHHTRAYLACLRDAGKI